MNWLVSLLTVVIVALLLFFAWVRWKYRFWALQPVFHFYNLSYYWIGSRGIIRHELPEKNRYVNDLNITTTSIEELDPLTKKRLVTFIQHHYWRQGDNVFCPKAGNIFPYFSGHFADPLCSVFTEPEYYMDVQTNRTIQEKKIVGVITSRPLHVSIRDTTDSNMTDFPVYYVDYLCVERTRRKRNIAPQLIQTHEYRQSHRNRKISVSVFKREDDLTAIVPLTVYKTYCFCRKKWKCPPALPPSWTILSGDTQNLYYFYDLLKTTKSKWKLTMVPEMSNLVALVTSGNLFVSMLMQQGRLMGAYIFRKTCTTLRQKEEILSCIGSIGLTDCDLFIGGFKVAVWGLMTSHPTFQHLTVEDISDNTPIINHLCFRNHPTVISPMAYFFYNFAYSTFPSNECFILN